MDLGIVKYFFEIEANDEYVIWKKIFNFIRKENKQFPNENDWLYKKKI